MTALSSDRGLSEFARLQEDHPIWSCRLLQGCRAGSLTRDDFRSIFAQYYRYSRNFTRYITAVMTNCENDYYRSKLSQNLWEEGGGADPAQRHTELFRRFLQNALDINPDSIRYQGFADSFFQRYMNFCRNTSALSGAAFLSLGTEGIISRLYEYFCDGLRQAGVAEEHLTFFRLHIGCDDEHSYTLSEMLLSYVDEPGWFELSKAAIQEALDLRLQFFDDVFDFAMQARMNPLLERIRNERCLLTPDTAPEDLLLTRAETGARLSGLYSNRVESQLIDFSVKRVGFGAEVFDVRLLKVEPDRTTELHQHAHESLLMVTRGRGRVRVGEFMLEVGPGDTVFVPRWTMHQSVNTGEELLEITAITDYELTKHAYLGDHLRTTRMNPERDASHQAVHA